MRLALVKWGFAETLVTALFVSAAAALAAPADASVERHRLRYGPVDVGGYDTVFPRAQVKTPRIDGFITAMHARLVDSRGRPVTIRDVMMHHIFFHRERGKPANYACASKRAEAFYGTGEEDQRLRLPRGYGYRIRSTDRWQMRSMLMSHTVRPTRVFIEYTVDVETDRRLIPVQAFWLRANGCDGGSGYHINGNGTPGSTHRAAFTWTVPYNMRIVAAGGHLHGGAKDMWLSQPRCRKRRLLDNRPSYAMPDHLYYRARPVLHEPGPIDTRFFTSRTGIAAAAGEKIRLHAVYDGELPRSVMAVMHVYVARTPAVKRGCQPLPKDRVEITKPGPTRPDPPQLQIPLNGLDARGRTHPIVDPPWPIVSLGANAEVKVTDAGFKPQRFTVPSATKLTWRFTGTLAHNVRLASGPRMVFTSTLNRGEHRTSTFRTPGRYTLFCSRHPVTMHAIMDVLTPDAWRPDTLTRLRATRRDAGPRWGRAEPLAALISARSGRQP